MCYLLTKVEKCYLTSVSSVHVVYNERVTMVLVTPLQSKVEWFSLLYHCHLSLNLYPCFLLPEKVAFEKQSEFQRMCPWNNLSESTGSLFVCLFPDIDSLQKCTMDNNDYFLYNRFIGRDTIRTITWTIIL